MNGETMNLGNVVGGLSSCIQGLNICMGDMCSSQNSGDVWVWGDSEGVERCGEVWGGVERCGKVWEGLGRCGEVWGGVGRCGEMWRGVGRF